MYRLVWESRGGSGPSATNSDYAPGLSLLLGRLAKLDASLEDALVDTRQTQRQGLNADDRRLNLGRSFPIRLGAVESLEDLRLEMGRAQVPIGQAPGTRGGNYTKRLQMNLSIPGYDGTSDQLEKHLASGSTDDTQAPNEGKANHELLKALKAQPLRKLTGPPEHWLTTLHTGFWGLTEDNRDKWSDLSEGDLFVLHATAPVYIKAPGLTGGVIGVGVLEATSEKRSLEWLEEIRSEENGWPLLLHFKEVWWFGDTAAIEDEPIRGKIAEGNDYLARDCRALLENRVSFGEMRKLKFQVPAQGSMARLKDENRDKLIRLLEPRLTRSLSRDVAPGRSAFSEVDPEDESLENLKRHSWGLKEIDPEESEEEASEREEQTITYTRNARAQEKASQGHRKLRRTVSQHLIELGLKPIESRIDVYVQKKAEAIVFELKTIHSKNFRTQTRSAVGQLFEYEYFEVPVLPDGSLPKVLKAVVYNKQPPGEILRYLASLDILSFWTTDGGDLTGSENAREVLWDFAGGS